MVNNFAVEFSACCSATVACKPTLAIGVVDFCRLIYTLASSPLGFEACTAEALCNLKVNTSEAALKQGLLLKLDQCQNSVKMQLRSPPLKKQRPLFPPPPPPKQGGSSASPALPSCGSSIATA